MEEDLHCKKVSKEPVCRDGNLITAKGAGCSMEFALEIIRYVKGDDNAEEIRRSVQCP